MRADRVDKLDGPGCVSGDNPNTVNRRLGRHV
jgi:hypothetical protein